MWLHRCRKYGIFYEAARRIFYQAVRLKTWSSFGRHITPGVCNYRARKFYANVLLLDSRGTVGATKNSDSEVQRIAIDGKAIRAAEKGGHIPYIISAYLGNYGLSIGQIKVGEKTNEIKEIPKLLKKLDITDCAITIDAIGCQKQIAKQIIEQKGHYCLAVKTNQAILYQEIKDYFSYAEKEEPEQINVYQTIEKNHGRIEK